MSGLHGMCILAYKAVLYRGTSQVNDSDAAVIHACWKETIKLLNNKC